jgi:hypothetical protein
VISCESGARQVDPLGTKGGQEGLPSFERR